MFGKAFKARSHYVFDYKPRYYDERKERLENLKKKCGKGEYETEETSSIRLTKNNLKSDWVKNKKFASDRRVTLRLAAIITIIVGILTYIFDLHKLF